MLLGVHFCLLKSPGCVIPSHCESGVFAVLHDDWQDNDTLSLP